MPGQVSEVQREVVLAWPGLPWVSIQTTTPDVAHVGALASAARAVEAVAASAATGISAAAQAIAAAPIRRLGELTGKCMGCMGPPFLVGVRTYAPPMTACPARRLWGGLPMGGCAGGEKARPGAGQDRVGVPAVGGSGSRRTRLRASRRLIRCDRRDSEALVTPARRAETRPDPGSGAPADLPAQPETGGRRRVCRLRGSTARSGRTSRSTRNCPAASTSRPHPAAGRLLSGLAQPDWRPAGPHPENSP
jgi:hypothetical protein